VKLSVSKGEKIEIQKMLLDMDKGSPSLDIRNATVGMSGPVSGFPGYSYVRTPWNPPPRCCEPQGRGSPMKSPGRILAGYFYPPLGLISTSNKSDKSDGVGATQRRNL
jgi:hypothetical protein